jgi:hypothetical protein
MLVAVAGDSLGTQTNGNVRSSKPLTSNGNEDVAVVSEEANKSHYQSEPPL